LSQNKIAIEVPLRAHGYSLMLQGLVLALMGLGLVMIYSAQGRVDKPPMQEDWTSTPAYKQVGFAVVSVIVMAVVSRIDYQWLRSREKLLSSGAVWMLILAVVLLIAVYIPGIGLEKNGARRWLKFPVTFQPSELAKLALVVFLASKLTDPNFPKREFWRGLLPICLVIGVICGLIGKEDFGTAALIALVSALMLLTGGMRVLYLVLPAIPASLGFLGLIIISPYRIKRLTTFLDIWSDPQGAGYHAIQSLIAIASGNWWGLGMGEGLQKYGYLPEDTTDFIFSIISEELGMAGGMAVLGVFVVFVMVGWLIYRHVRDPFGKLMVFGLVSMVGLQAAINVAVATVSMPTKGIALPFVSAGGSGLIFSAVAVGLICSVYRYSEYELSNE